jgi:alkylhydroperoxidase family enzyme
MHLLNAWREAPIYSARQRAVLAWTEAVTKISDGHVEDEVYDEARHFSEKELVDLTAAVIAINAWNRAAIAFRATPQLTSAKIAA